MTAIREMADEAYRSITAASGGQQTFPERPGALPEKQERWYGEMIDGIFYEMSPPSLPHQTLVFEIGSCLREQVLAGHRTALVMTLPLRVRLSSDNLTALLPDVAVICDPGRIEERSVYGPPDLVAEVLSRGTEDRDRYLKLMKYMQAGVREYWIVDPEACTVMVYEKNALIVPMTYTFDDCIPVGIWKRECGVDFRSIRERMASLGIVFHL